MKFKITITKDVIEKSLKCGSPDSGIDCIKGCALAEAINELIPNVNVAGPFIRFCNTPFDQNIYPQDKTFLAFVIEFDNHRDSYFQRYSLVGRELFVEIPDEVIEYYYGDAVKAAQKIINNPILQPA